MTPKRKLQLDETLLKIAEQIATMSFATRTKVGAILFKDGNIISMGWNGMPSGFPNSEIEIKNEDGTLTTNTLVLHAESNALSKCAASNGNTNGSTLYVTINPCMDCAKSIIQCGIKRVVFRDYYRIRDAVLLLERAGIIVDRLVDGKIIKE